jgi:ribosome production factor 1
MAPTRLNASVIGNKMKREQVYRAAKREKKQEKLKRRIQQAELEKKNPELREVGSFSSKLWNMPLLTYSM